MRRLAAFLALSGCSFVWVEAPPSPRCSETRWAPITDTVLAPVTLALGGYAGYRIDHDKTCVETSPGSCAFADMGRGLAAGVTVLASAFLTAVFVRSAVDGYRSVDPERCRAAKLAPPPLPAIE